MGSKQLKPGFLWWRAGRYEIERGVVKPADDPEPFVVSSGGAMWDELKALHDNCEGETLSPSAERAICDWCKQYGLPGYLLQTTERIFLPPRTHAMRFGLTKETATSFRRGAGRWATEQVTIRADGPAGYGRPGRFRGFLERADFTKRPQPPVVREGFTSFLIENDRDASWLAFAEPDLQKRESITRLDTHLRCEVDDCPQPGTQEFFNQYQEPIEDFFRAARLLAWMEAACKAAGDDTLALLNQFAGLGPVVAPNSQTALTGPSLLAAFAVERLTRSRSIRRCEFSGCERPFLPGKSEKRYCEDRCRYADAKRKARATQKSGKNSIS